MPDQPFNPDDLAPVSILSLNGGIDPFSYVMTSSGANVYIVWEPKSNPPPKYYQILRAPIFDGNYQVIATVNYPADSYVDSEGTTTCFYKIREISETLTVLTTSGPISAEDLIISQSLYYQIQGLMNHRINNELAIFGRSRDTAQFVFKNWNTLPRPEIRINCSNDDGSRDPWLVLDDSTPIFRTFGQEDDYANGLKYKLTWNGKIFFVDQDDVPVAVHTYNEIEASYFLRVFRQAEIKNAMMLALGEISAQPGTNKYTRLGGLPLFYDAAIVVGATYYLLRQLHVMCMNPEIRMLLLDPESGAFNSMDQLRESIKLYEEDWKELLKTIGKARYPNMRTIITPEFQMPGGRSRMFRYAFGLG